MRHIWPGPSGNDWFTSLLSSPSNTFLSHFNLGAAQQAAQAHTHTHKHTSARTQTHTCVHDHMLTHICTHALRHRHTRSALATVGVHFLVLQRFQPLSSKGWALFHPFLSKFFSHSSLSFLSLRVCVSLSLVSVLLTVENL